MKMKTHRGAAKRFKKTGGGGYKRKRAYLRHGMRKRNQDGTRYSKWRFSELAQSTFTYKRRQDQSD